VGTYIFLTFLFLALGLAFRLAFNIRQFYIKKPTINEALNLPHNRPIKVLDTGTTTDNYCTEEFYYRKGKELLPSILPLAYILTFIVPLFFVLYMWITGRVDYNFIKFTFLFIVVGSALERWSFFVEGNHVQNLFYGLYPEEGYTLKKGLHGKEENKDLLQIKAGAKPPFLILRTCRSLRLWWNKEVLPFRREWCLQSPLELQAPLCNAPGHGKTLPPLQAPSLCPLR
jgi:hypothetical protein